MENVIGVDIAENSAAHSGNDWVLPLSRLLAQQECVQRAENQHRTDRHQGRRINAQKRVRLRLPGIHRAAGEILVRPAQPLNPAKPAAQTGKAEGRQPRTPVIRQAVAIKAIDQDKQSQTATNTGQLQCRLCGDVRHCHEAA